jgi:fructose-specific component phosphotransferase system IIB-like protein
MPRHAALSRSLLVLIASFSLVACDGGNTKTPEPTVVKEPEPEPEPEPEGPSNEPTQTWAEAWSTPSGQPTGQIAAIQDDRIYAIVGAFAELGTPATHVVSIAADTGELLWTYKQKKILSFVNISPELIELGTDDGKKVIIGTAAGKVKKPTKAQTEALAVAAPEPAAHTCSAEGTKVSCEGWSVDEAGAASDLVVADARVCYAVAGAREIRCRATDTGDLVFVVAVPAIPDVKEPEAVNFGFELIGDRLIVANYDGTISAYSPQ